MTSLKSAYTTIVTIKIQTQTITPIAALLVKNHRHFSTAADSC